MTIEEKRQAIDRFCFGQNGCMDCPLGDGRGYCSFDDFYDISAKEVEIAYNIAYGNKKEEINHPDRYKSGKFECIDVMLDVFGVDAVKHFCILNAFKYIWRAEKKNGVEDIKKAV